jgi:hypothetical protein
MPEWTGDTYRQQCVDYIIKSGMAMAIHDKWNYQFGIFTGTTLQHIYRLFRKYAIPVEKILAFDSFEGLPEETPGISRNPIWQKHEFNMRYTFRTDDDNEIIRRIEAELPDRAIPIEWHKGYFCDVLTDAFMATNPLPAFWVDLDVDLYRSALDVLDFMFKHHLIVPGTLLSYDDWGGTEEFKGGESLAHKEMCEKYGVTCKDVHTHRSDNREHCQKVFQVEGVLR